MRLLWIDVGVLIVVVVDSSLLYVLYSICVVVHILDVDGVRIVMSVLLLILRIVGVDILDIVDLVQICVVVHILVFIVVFCSC